MSDTPFTVLVLCTGNSARSILGEALFNQLGLALAGRKVRAFSAGSQPKGAVHPAALRLLARRGIDTCAYRSKSWDEFAASGAPQIDLAITVCGNAAGEACPVFLGSPIKAHWGLPDPAAAAGPQSHIDAAFEETWRLLEMRVRALLALDLAGIDRRALTDALARIGAMEGAA